MNELIDALSAPPVQQATQPEPPPLPYSVYQSIKEQHIFNVPIAKPLLIVVLNGTKNLGNIGEVTCSKGNFIFLSNHPAIDMRNIPDNEEYSALLISFDYEDFPLAPNRKTGTDKFIKGSVEPILELALRQFVEWSWLSPPSLWSSRKQELVRLIYDLGYHGVISLMEAPRLSHKVYGLVMEDLANDRSAEKLATILSMSESTLRRKLKAEGTSVQDIKDQARLSHGLHLMQTTMAPIGRIAEQCGYDSQSRFTDRFKRQFGIKPSDLRKTRMLE